MKAKVCECVCKNMVNSNHIRDKPSECKADHYSSVTECLTQPNKGHSVLLGLLWTNVMPAFRESFAQSFLTMQTEDYQYRTDEASQHGTRSFWRKEMFIDGVEKASGGFGQRK